MIVDLKEEITKKDKYEGETVFASSRGQSALSHASVHLPAPYTLTPKLVWVDVPKTVSWMLGHVSKWEGSHANTSYHIGEAMLLEEKTPQDLKATLAFIEQHKYHVFTQFYKDGVSRWRITKKPYVDIKSSWGKKGLARTIQDNRFYVHHLFDADTYCAHALASIPEIRMAKLKRAEGQAIQTMESMIEYCEKMQKKHKAHVEKLEEGNIVDNAINRLMLGLMGMELPTTMGKLFTGKTYYSYGERTIPKDYTKPVDQFKVWKDENMGESVLEPQVFNETHAKMNHGFMECFMLWNAQVEKSSKIEERVREAITTILKEEMEGKEVKQDE
jgi:hypothetical protein